MPTETPGDGTSTPTGDPWPTSAAVVGRCPPAPGRVVKVGAWFPAGNGGTRVGLGQVSSGQCCTGAAVEVVPLGTSTVQGMAVVGGALGCMVLNNNEILNNFDDDDVNYFLGIHHPRNFKFFGVGRKLEFSSILVLLSGQKHIVKI